MNINKMKLSMKIGGGFGFVLMLLLIVAFFSWQGLTTITDGLQEYDRRSNNSNMISSLQGTMLQVRLNVMSFMVNHNDKALQEYQKYSGQLQSAIDEAKETIRNPERKANISKIDIEVDTYTQAFGQAVTDTRESTRILNEELQPLGSSILKGLAEITTSARDNQDLEAVFNSGLAVEHMLQARLYVQKFLTTGELKDSERVNAENAKLQDRIAQLFVTDHPQLKTQAQKVLDDVKNYMVSFNLIAKATNSRSNAYNNTLASIGPKVATLVDTMLKSYVADQQELGTTLKATSQTSIRTMLIIALAAILLGIIFAIFLTRAITGTVRKTAAFAQTMANGDFTNTLDVKQGDEIGLMANSLNDMVAQLGSMIKEIASGVSSLSLSSTDLAAVSNQLSSAAKDTSDKSGSVATATEEMSTNFQSVSAAMEQSTANVNIIASSTEEMTSTVNEIAESAEKARIITDGAVKQSQDTSIKMADLGESAKRIGKVTEAITEISEQTNLLALNATIEAARAGEAGKGFAVVANEIKELAQQTAEATVDIKDQINEIQVTTGVTIEDISRISDVIVEINGVINAIATAVEEQSTATSEIAGNIAQASMGIGEVNENVAQSTAVVSDITRDISEINSQSNQVEEGSIQVQTSAQNLSALAVQLEIMVNKFKV